MPRLNRVDPFGDLHRVPERGMFTGNRGCLVDDSGEVVRHHNGSLWIVCVTEYKDWKSPLAAPRHWTPLFFLDDAVALAAGHRPCGLCRRNEYLNYRGAVQIGLGLGRFPAATELNRMLARERLAPGRGLQRAADRRFWDAEVGSLPVGTVIVVGQQPVLVTEDLLFEFGFAGWTKPTPRPASGRVTVLTPPTSVLAMASGYGAVLHHSAHP